MKKLVLAGILILASGCAGVAHLPRMYLMPQVGVILTVVNNCTPVLDGDSPTHGVLFRNLPYGSSVTLPLSSVAFSGSSREIAVLVRGSTKAGTYLGSATRTFYVDTYRGTRSKVWEVDHIRADGNPGGCGLGK